MTLDLTALKAAAFDAAGAGLEIRDANGNLLGLFAPSNMSEEKELYEKAKRLFNPVEIERRKREEGGQGVPLVEVWKRILSHENKQ